MIDVKSGPFRVRGSAFADETLRVLDELRTRPSGRNR